MLETRSSCPYCGVGCGVIIQSQGAQITGVRGDPDHPANRGRLCTKGSTLHLTATADVMASERLLQPMQRATRDAAAPWTALSWDQATNTVAERLADVVDRHGPDALGFYVSGQLLTEDYYVFNKLAKGLLGTNNIDTNSRLCMSSAVAGYKQSLGADAPPACYEDLQWADCVLIAGSNTAWAHPVLYRQLEDAKRARPNMKVIVVDPRRTETADDADLHLAIQPGTDVALFQGMLHALIWDGRLDRSFIESHTTGFQAVKDLVRDMPPERAAQRCGIDVAALLQAARWFADAPASLSLYCQGLNQSSSGTAKNTALINLHLATGQIGKRGAGPLSLTGQPNAMGGREVGGMANLLSAHRDLGRADHRAEVATLWGIDAVPATPGKTAVEMFEAAARGEIKALWIACTNPAQSMPDQAMVRRALARCELVILQEAFAGTATAAYADMLLPATTWGEKEGTVTNSERCISRVRAAVPAPGAARHDWRIARDVAHALESRWADATGPGSGRPTLFPYETPESIWLEHRESTRGRDLDITGLSYAKLEQAGPAPWPYPEGATQGRARLYEDRRFATPDGRARFVNAAFKPPADSRDAKHPFVLTTTRSRDQWHGMSRSGTVPRLFAHDATPALRMHPHDLPRRSLKAGDLARVRSRRGQIVVPIVADDRVRQGQADLPMHWGSEFLGGAADGRQALGVNTLTTPAFCPDAKQPELKYSAVSIERATLPWRVRAALWCDDAQQLAALKLSWRAWMPQLDYASVVPVGGAEGRVGLRLDGASAQPVGAELLDQLAHSMGLHATGTARYVDTHRHRMRWLGLADTGAAATLKAALVGGEADEGAWLIDLWQQAERVAPFGRALLAPDSAAPTGLTPRSPQVCNCLDVSAASIQAWLAQHPEGSPAERLGALQQQLHCGTQCGSCLPALRRMVATQMTAPLVTPNIQEALTP